MQQSSVSVFSGNNAVLSKKGDANFSTVSSSELSTVLESPYVDFRTKNGRKPYSCDSMLNARSAIQRHLAYVRLDNDSINRSDFGMENNNVRWYGKEEETVWR